MTEAYLRACFWMWVITNGALSMAMLGLVTWRSPVVGAFAFLLLAAATALAVWEVRRRQRGRIAADGVSGGSR